LLFPSSIGLDFFPFPLFSFDEEGLIKHFNKPFLSTFLPDFSRSSSQTQLSDLLARKSWFSLFIPRFDRDKIRLFLRDKTRYGPIQGLVSLSANVRPFFSSRPPSSSPSSSSSSSSLFLLHFFSPYPLTQPDLLACFLIPSPPSPPPDELEFFIRTLIHDLNNKLSILGMAYDLSDKPKFFLTLKNISEYLNNLRTFTLSSPSSPPSSPSPSSSPQTQTQTQTQTLTQSLPLLPLVRKVIRELDLVPELQLKTELFLQSLQKTEIKFNPREYPQLPTHLEQILFNLIINVFLHAQATKMQIWAKEKEEMIYIFIRDNGKGIPPYYQYLIRQKTEHTLGLTICYKLIEKYPKSKLSFHSTIKGKRKGTTFCIEIPKTLA